MKTSILVIIGLVACESARAEPFAVASLRPNDIIRIEFHSSGCFHQSTKKFEITRDTAGKTWFDAAERKEQWNKEKKKMEQLGLERIGKVALTPEEITGLDSLFQFYRQKHPGGCTSVDEAHVVYERDGATVGTEEFRDGTCMTLSVDLYLKDKSMRDKLGSEFDWDLLKRVVTFSRIESRIKPDKT